ncbi:MAG: hypothetical protein COB08_014810 [Rhodobacteraceae bacterium]|nr:hypothetical protein [Paracoccaceae bacterium]
MKTTPDCLSRETHRFAPAEQAEGRVFIMTVNLKDRQTLALTDNSKYGY